MRLRHVQRASASSESVRVVVVVVEDEVPAVEAVLAAVGDDVARQPDAVLAGMGQQVTPSSAIDAHDRRFRFQRDPRHAIR